MEKICEYCGKCFNARRSTVRFCSVKCKDNARTINLRGQKFGYWKVLDYDPEKSKKGNFWRCKCECGTEKYVWMYDLKSGNSTSCGCKNKLPSGENCCRWMFNNYKKQALSRGHIFELTLDQFKVITKQDCFYCGSKPNNVCDRSSSNANGVYIYNGIDRVDNNKGYSVDNVVPCCKKCNSMKSKMDKKGFYDQIMKIHAKIPKNSVGKS